MKNNEILEILFDDNNDITTNYFETELCAGGKMYWTVGKNHTIHLFVPPSLEAQGTVKEMLTGKYAVMTKGIHRELEIPMTEIMFEDNSDSPFAIWLDQKSSPYFLDETWNRKKSTLIIWTKEHNLECTIYFRTGKPQVLPYAKPIDRKTFTKI